VEKNLVVFAIKLLIKINECNLIPQNIRGYTPYIVGIFEKGNDILLPTCDKKYNCLPTNLFNIILYPTQLHNVMESLNCILYLIHLYDSITLCNCADCIIFINFNAIAQCYGVTQFDII